MKKVCEGQCEGCAFRNGAAANLESDNRIKGVFAALGGQPFACHESLGWHGDRKGYPPGAINAFSVLQLTATTKAMLPASVIAAQRAKIPDLRMCGGWKVAVARLNRDGWFRNADVRLARRHASKSALIALDEFTSNSGTTKNAALAELHQWVDWFKREAKQSKVKIGWLFS